MQIDFFNKSCMISSKEKVFGLCDDDDKKPAYIDEKTPDDCIAIVQNNDRRRLEFYAIDNCAKIVRADGKMISLCDGLLKYDSNIIFVELKSRKRDKEYVQKGISQLISTIKSFKIHNDIKKSTTVRAHISNNLRPTARKSHAVKLEQFKEQTGYLLRIGRRIDI